MTETTQSPQARALTSIEPFTGPHAIPGIRFRAVASALGVSSWGMNVLEFDANATGHPEHDHIKDGQEEVYFVLSGSVTLAMGEEKVELGQHEFLRVPPERTRKILAGSEGAVVLALGAVPGKPYTSMF